jgi:hypothetical protein
MARFSHVYGTEHPGVVRFTRAAEVIGSWSTSHAVVAALAFIGSPVRRAIAKAGVVLQAQAAARKQRREDERLWNVALGDARVMADLSRAMSAQASRDARAQH